MVNGYELAGLEFEWDETKDDSNREKHGLSFREGAEAFLDPNRTLIGNRITEDGEMRHGMVGRVDGNVLLVVFTMRDGRIRIISVRKAHRNERAKYRGLQA